MADLPILLADDDANDVFLMRRAFAKAGLPARLHVVADGEEAMTYLKGEGKYADRQEYPFPALLLLDLKMPKMDGLETLSVIRRDEHLRRLVVIMLTSSREERDINRAFDLRANSYLVKPSSNDALLDVLGKLKQFWLDLNHYPTCPVSAGGGNQP
jgi:CheY-like chemotaxis protein